MTKMGVIEGVLTGKVDKDALAKFMLAPDPKCLTPVTDQDSLLVVLFGSFVFGSSQLC